MVQNSGCEVSAQVEARPHRQVECSADGGGGGGVEGGGYLLTRSRVIVKAIVKRA